MTNEEYREQRAVELRNQAAALRTIQKQRIHELILSDTVKRADVSAFKASLFAPAEKKDEEPKLLPPEKIELLRTDWFAAYLTVTCQQASFLALEDHAKVAEAMAESLENQ